MWDEIAKELSRKHQIIRLDFPGFGQSESIADDNAMKLFAWTTNELLSRLKVTDFKLIGHSMGAYVALELACICQNKIKHLVLLHSTAKADSEQKQYARIRAIEAVKEKKNIYLRTAIPLLASKQLQEICKKHIKKMTQEAEALSPEGILVALVGMRQRETHTKTVQKFKGTITYISGTFDPVLSNDAIKDEAYNNGADFIEIKNAGHMSHWENPNELKAQLLKLI
tara:strand:+ start:3160 stop:3837 length:678 start_codon:yes stop_codon:yes gene_type:complete